MMPGPGSQWESSRHPDPGRWVAGTSGPSQALQKYTCAGWSKDENSDDRARVPLRRVDRGAARDGHADPIGRGIGRAPDGPFSLGDADGPRLAGLHRPFARRAGLSAAEPSQGLIVPAVSSAAHAQVSMVT